MPEMRCVLEKKWKSVYRDRLRINKILETKKGGRWELNIKMGDYLFSNIEVMGDLLWWQTKFCVREKFSPKPRVYTGLDPCIMVAATSFGTMIAFFLCIWIHRFIEQMSKEHFSS